MKKKTLCGILVTTMLLSLCPATAFAAGSTPISITEGLDFRNKNTDADGIGWHWDANDKMLTLDGFRVAASASAMEYEPVILLPDESTLVLEGDDNYIKTYPYKADAIHCEGELLICGDGKLEIITATSSSSAIYCEGGPLVIEDSAEITVDPEGYVIFIRRARGSDPIISILDEAKVVFPEEDADGLLVSHTTSVTPADNWLNFSMDEDKTEKTVTMKAKTEKPKKDTVEVPAKDEYKITVGSPAIMKNGVITYTADVSPYLSNGYTMLPLRALLEVSNPDQKVTWNNGTKSAHTFVNNKLVSIKPGETTYTRVTDQIELSTPAETVNGRLFVSLRDWMNIMDIDVSQLDWDAETKTVTLKY